MRTALILLFLLALASVPGSVLPQEGIDPAAVSQYYTAAPGAGADPEPAVAVQRVRRALVRRHLPAAVRLAGRLRAAADVPAGRVGPAAAAAGAAATSAGCPCQRQLPAPPLPPRRRCDAAAGAAAATGGSGSARGDGWVSAEKGYLREVGNLLFHIALLALLVSVGLGGIFGYKANRLLVVGQGFANTPTALDVFRPGRLVVPVEPAPFAINLLSFRATYVTSGPQLDQPITYRRALSYRAAPGGAGPALRAPGQPPAGGRQRQRLPDRPRLRAGVQGHRRRGQGACSTGRCRSSRSTRPSSDLRGRRQGAGRQPDAAGLRRRVPADARSTRGGQLESAFPAALDPRVSLVAYAGNLGMNTGASQSVYTLDMAGHAPAAGRAAAAGAGPVDDAAGRRREASPSPATGSGSAWPSPTTRASCPRWSPAIAGPGRADLVVHGPPPPGVRARARAGRTAAPRSRSAAWPGPTRRAGSRRSSPSWPGCCAPGTAARSVQVSRIGGGAADGPLILMTGNEAGRRPTARQPGRPRLIKPGPDPD